MYGVGSSLPVPAYERAEGLLSHHRNRLVLHASVSPRWIGDGHCFWYSVQTRRGVEYLVADPARSLRAPAFDQERLAQGVLAAGGPILDPWDLRIEVLEISDVGLSFSCSGQQWRCSPSDYSCRIERGVVIASPLEVSSPDGRWVAFRRDHDVWIRAAAGGDEIQLTRDGTSERGYAVNPDQGSQRQLMLQLGLREAPPVLAWSPDSSRLVTHRIDQLGVGISSLIESAPAENGLPRVHNYRYATPGAATPTAEWVVLNVETHERCEVQLGPFHMPPRSPLLSGKVWWSPDGQWIYFLNQARDRRRLEFWEIDGRTGRSRLVLVESGTTRVDPVQSDDDVPNVRVLDASREFLWYSQRDGVGRLYLYDLDTGHLVRGVDSGTAIVQHVLNVDERTRVAHLAVSGLVHRDPYVLSVMKVDLDGGDPELVTDDEMDHRVHFPGHGQWFVDTASSVASPPVVSVRRLDGSVIMELERADIARLESAGWTAPERITVTAADGVTEISGLLYRPYGFDESEKYPVVDHVYPGPHLRRTQPYFAPGYFGADAEAIAALGFVVVAFDGRGTPGRDKAFHDFSYHNLGGALEDHVAGLHQLAERLPWIDLDRVGIIGQSAGGFAAVRGLARYPHMFKVAISESGNHDNRAYEADWVEAYHGEIDFAEDSTALSNTELAGSIEGELLLVHGELDENVAPHQTMRLVDRLIAENKDFDLLIVPGATHSLFGYMHYVTRRRWDFLVRKLLLIEPPPYEVSPFPIPEELRALVGGPETSIQL